MTRNATPSDPRRILVAVGGGISAYKIPELVRELIRGGARVRCILTPNATRFVSPMVLAALTQSPASSALFPSSGASLALDGGPSSEDFAAPGGGSEIDHIELADWAELVCVAPATANLIARMRTGIADDLPTAVLLATRAPILVAPAMNVNMWEHPATQENLAVLRDRGVVTVGPESGELACGWQGQGRMAEPAQIAEAALASIGSSALAGETVLVTAGGTQERIDAVRTIANRSSGRMGFCIAAEAARRGADVVLVSGPTSLPTPFGVRRVDVESALDMRDAVLLELSGATIVIKAAAVADFRPASPSERKIKKEDLADGAGFTLELVQNPDILAEICRQKGDRIVVGFGAESHDLVEASRRKIRRKGCDLLVANDVSRSDAGFDVETNAVSFVTPDGDVEELPLLSKAEVAAQLLDRVGKMRDGRR